MFCVVHPNYTTIGKGKTIDLALADWTKGTDVDVDDELFAEFTFVEGEEVKVQRVISYEKVPDHAEKC